MKKKFVLSLLLIVALVTITGCKDNKKEDKSASQKFKEEYESLNGKTNSGGKEHRTLNIDSNNPYVKVEPSDIVKLLEDKETFYLYVGDPLCPWCRSVLEKSIEVAKDYKIDKIYYIDIWDEDGKEILRDKYEMVDGKLTKTIEGTKEYDKLLEAFDSVLKDYSITDNGKDIATGEKRIYAPNYFYIKDGKVKGMTTGKSDKLTDPRSELTEEILADQQKLFEDFFTEFCDSAC